MGDAATLERLLAAGHLTAAQARRVKAAMARGTSLVEALQSTPLVEPLHFHRAAAEAAAEQDARDAAEWRPEPIDGPIEPGSGLGREHFHDMPPHRHTAEAEPHLPATAEELATRIQHPADPAPYRRGAPAPALHLGDHEGIPLVRELHGLIQEVIEHEGIALELDTRDQRAGVARIFNAAGRLAARRLLDRTRTAKMAHHFLVRARLPAWSGKPIESSLDVSLDAVEYRVLIHSEADLLRLFFTKSP
ncbi:MAG: hypothetical protein SF028_09095 [Candidatus Sumerlaeia bacterium]|nr:hypothetical protein [Candidatus Sumerlaeia bacterium]